MRRSIEKQWYGRPGWLLLLAPLSGLFYVLATLRRLKTQRNQKDLPLPVVVIGNISVGGTGKTPVIIALVEALRQRGWRPAVISRGYGGSVHGSRIISATDTPEQVGDEPLLITRSARCSVAVGRDRVASVELLAKQTDCNVILSDDGMQHYRMARDMEIAVIDAGRGLGNGWLMPVGPLREPAKRLRRVDWVLLNGEQKPRLPAFIKRQSGIVLKPLEWRNLLTGEIKAPDDLPIDSATAVAGIGHPQRFFATLANLGFRGPTFAFPDHHPFSEPGLAPFQEKMLLMTEKDAVKCTRWAGPNWWALQVGFALPVELIDDIVQRLST